MESFELIKASDLSSEAWQSLLSGMVEVWPEFILHDPVGNRYWEELPAAFGACQFAIRDSQGRVMGTGNSIPLHLDLNRQLPEGGWDWALEQGFADLAAGAQATALCGLQIGINPDLQGRGVSRFLIDGMKRIAVELGLKALVLPIRPTWKHKYPLIPMSDYITWTDPQGLPYDPWIRAHARSGGEIVGICGRSMYIPGSVAEWEEWTGLAMQTSGEYIVDRALAPVTVSVEQNRAEYVEPNVWMRYTL